MRRSRRQLERERFSQKYQEMHRLVREPDGARCCTLAQKTGPFCPASFKEWCWYFDSKTVCRNQVPEIGENEATAIQVCNAFALAKSKAGTKATSDDDSISQYAKAFSRPVQPVPNPRVCSLPRVLLRIVSGISSGDSSYVPAAREDRLALVAYPADIDRRA